jgi:N-acetylglucosaminyl-diphospho-decaprenol L-rhamnosyltransferase
MPGCDLSVLIVTFNSRVFVGDCVAAVDATVREHAYEIVVVDNDSHDGTAAFLRAEFPNVRLIEMGRNAGFSTANNRAFAASSGRHVVLLNGDATPMPGALDTLVSFLDEHPEAGIAAPRLENPDGSDQGTARTFPTPAAAVFGRRSPLTRVFPNNRFSTRYLAGRAHDGTEAFEIDWVSGACLMMSRATASRVGGLDESFFMYWEDADLCRRVKQSGLGVWCVPAARVMHAEGGSRRGWPAPQVRHFHRSAYRYYAKHHLTGPRRLLRPVAASALAGRAALIIARDAVRAGGRTTSTATSTADLSEYAVATPGRGAIEAGEIS